MPLSRPASRTLLHLRDIVLRGYERADGLLDIEAHMTDTKTTSFPNRDRGGVHAGEPLHDMWLRVTVDRALVIIACEAAMDGTPYAICPQVAPHMERLVGLKIAPGFLKSAMLRLAGIEGCTHLRELLQPIATAAFQTTIPLRAGAKAGPGGKIAAGLMNSCYAYRETGPVWREQAGTPD